MDGIIEGYTGPDEIDTEYCTSLYPEKFTNGRITSERIVVYRDTKTGRFISEKGLFGIVKENVS